MLVNDKGLQKEHSGVGKPGSMRTLTWSLLHLSPRGVAEEAPGPRAAAYWREVGSFLVLSPSGPKKQRGHRLFSASLVRTLVLRAVCRLCGSRRRGDSRAGMLGKVWRCEWLGAPWRDTLLGEALRCTSEGVAAEHIWLGPASRTTHEASTLFSHP